MPFLTQNVGLSIFDPTHFLKCNKVVVKFRHWVGLGINMCIISTKNRQYPSNMHVNKQLVLQ